MIQSKSQIFRRAGRRTFGALLLALPVCGLIVQGTPVQAQPAPNPPATFQPAPLTAQQTKDLDRITSVSHYEEVCKLALDLKLENGTIEDAIIRIKAAFPSQQIEIRQRDARPLQLSLNLKDTTVGTVLSGMAALSDAKLWVLPDGLLIAPPGKLNASERELVDMAQAGEWAQSGENPSNSGEHGRNAGTSWSVQDDADMPLANIIADEIKLLKVDGLVKTTFGQLSPQSQKALWQLVDWSNGNRPLMQPLLLSSGSSVEISLSKPNWITIDMMKGASDPNATQISMNILLSK